MREPVYYMCIYIYIYIYARSRISTNSLENERLGCQFVTDLRTRLLYYPASDIYTRA